MATITGTSGNDNLNGTDVDDTILGLAGDDNLSGGAGNDSLLGGDGDDRFTGGAGNDTMDGGADGQFGDRVNYTTSGAGVQVNLTTGVASDGMGGTDTLIDIEHINGSAFADTLTGNAKTNWFLPGAGDDTVDGRDGRDVVMYEDASAAVIVNLKTGTASGASIGTDSLTSIEAAHGSNFNDSLTLTDGGGYLFGRGGNDTLVGGAGNDNFIPGSGNDAIVGGAGTDMVSYIFDSYTDSAGTPTMGVTVYLTTGLATDNWGGTDTLASIENASGSDLADTLIGDANNNYLEGLGGNDTILGGNGADTVKGGAGNDSMDGGAQLDTLNGSDFNLLNYTGSLGALYINTSAGTASGASDGTDTFANFNLIIGGSGNDTIIGGPELHFEQFEGGPGNDSLDGGVITDTLKGVNSNRVSYQNAGAGVVVDLAAGTATTTNITITGNSGTDTLANFDQVRGSNFADSLYGTDRTDQTEQFEGRDGNDYIDGRGGFDLLRFGSATGPVTASLVSGTASGNGIGTDTFVNIEGFRGSSFNDTLTGGLAANGTIWSDGLSEVFRGEAGNDLIDGGQGYDRVDYTSSTSAVNVKLNDALDGTASDGLGGTDTLRNIEGVRGSDFNDTLTGSDTAVFESFEGRAGADTIDGLGGLDRADYNTAEGAVTVNLSAQLASNDGYGSIDVLRNIENVRGSSDFNDNITGDSANNLLQGQGGNDTLNGGGGNDTLQGGSGDDWIDGSSGSDTVDGGSGYDRANYRNLGVAVTIDMTAGTVVKAGGGTDTLISIERVMGSELADSILGSAADDDFSGNQGNDTLDGGAGGDNVWYGNATSAVVVDLQAGTATGGEGSDTLISIEYVEGSGYADTLLGSSVDNYFRGDGGTTDTRGGADYIDGRAGFDVVDYRDDPQRVTVSLASGLATDGRGYTDTLISIEEARGSEYNDVLTGSTNLYFERFEGRGGNDTIDGGAITDTLNQDNANQVSYLNAVGAVTVNLASGSASGAAGNDVLLNFNQVRGSGFDDMLIGSNRTDVTEHFEGGLGNDTIDGAGGFDVLRFDRSTAAVVASLVSGTATGAGIGSDTFSNIEGLFGSSYNDVLTGGLAANGVTVGDGLSEIFKGGAGNDTIDGGQGYDRADYTSALAGVNVQLNDTLDGSASDGQGGTDVLRSIEGVRGSDFNDTLTGSDTAAYESFEGRAGADTIDGRGGVDRADYQQARAGVAVNLALQVASNDGYGSSDILLNLENVRGSRDFNDTILGSASNNRLEGLGGDDTLTGGSGNDTLEGGDGNDTARFTLTMSGSAAVGLAWNAAQSAFLVTQGAVTLAKISAGATSGSWAVQDISNATVSGFGLDVLSGIETLVFDSVAGSTPVLSVATADLAAEMASATGMLINGTPNADNLTGGTGNDTIFGFAGDDTITATAGLDSIDGGTGTDTLVLDYSGDALAVTDLVIPSQVVDLSGTPQSVNLRGRFGLQTVGGIDNLLVTLTPFDDRATTSNLNDTVSGGSGNDWIDSAGGNDVLSGNDGNDWLYGSNGVDSVSGGAGNDTLGGGEGNDTLDGGAGYDWARFGTNDGQVPGSALNLNFSDAAWTQSAFTVTDSNGQIDTLIGIEAVLVEGSEYADVLKLGLGNDIVYANSGNDSVEGGVGDDFLSGGAGNDTLRGGPGNDLLNGGEQRNLGWRYGQNYATSDYDTADYTDVTVGGIRLDLSTMTVTGVNGADVGIDTLRGIEDVRGTRQADVVVGSFVALSGNSEASGDQHALDMELYGGSDTVTLARVQSMPWLDGPYMGYWWSQTAVTATFSGSVGTLSYGVGSSQVAGADTVDGVASFGDSAYNDQFDFSGMTSNFQVGARWNYVNLNQGGNDTVIGNGDTTVNFSGNTLVSTTGKGIEVRLAAPGTTFTVDMTHLSRSSSWSFGTVTLSNIEAVRGTNLDDTLVGGAYDDYESFRGKGGNDFIDGSSGEDQADYWGATAGIVVNLAAGSVTGDSSVGSDTLRSVERIRGTAFDDVYDARGFSATSTNAGSWDQWNLFDGRGGNDTIHGNGKTMLAYGASAVAVEVNLATGKAWALNPADRTGDLNQYVGTDTFTGVFRVRGTALGDLLLGGGAGWMNGDTAIEMFDPDAGNDTVNGSGGLDTVRYSSSTAAITVDLRLATGQVQDGMGGVDTLINIEGVQGSDFNDSMIGSDANIGYEGYEYFQGRKGNDTINGGGGYDEAGYEDDPTNGVVVNLATGVAQDGWGGTDTLSNIEGVEGSWKADSITGSSADNRLDGHGGNDTLDGGAGIDTAEYNQATGAVQVNLALGTAAGADGNDLLISIENVIGSIYGDQVTGNAAANLLEGLAGNDLLIGGAGNDSLIGGEGGDTLRGGAGDDHLNGGKQVYLNWRSQLPLTDYDTADYSDVTTGGIRLDLSTMRVTGVNGADVGIDTLRGIEVVNGTRQSDVVVGSLATLSGNNEAAGDQHSVDLSLYGGSDSVNVGAIMPWESYSLNYRWSNTAVTATFNGSAGTISYGVATGQLAGTDSTVGIQSFGGTAYNDRFDFSGLTSTALAGSRENYVNLADGGSDTVVGNGATQVNLLGGATYSSTTGLGINVHLAAPGVSFTVDMTHLSKNNGSVVMGIATLSDINRIRGSNLNDTLVGGGNDGFEGFRGLGGNDSIDGGTGWDRSEYQTATSGVTVNLAAGTASGDSSVGSDTLRSIEMIMGSWFDDTFDARGFSGSSVNAGSYGDANWFEGRGGNDTIYGNGNTRLDYSYASVAIEANMATGKAYALDPANRTGELALIVGEDTFSGVSRIRGSALGDNLLGGGAGRMVGTTAIEEFEPGAGNDTVNGGGGYDKVIYAGNKSGYTVTTTANGVTVVDKSGAEGTDTLIGIEQLVFADGTTDLVGAKPTLSGIAYDWKNHMLLQDVAVAVKGGTPAEGANAPIQFKGLVWDASGHASVEVWTHATTAFESAGFDLEITNASGITFTAGTLPNTSTGGTGWTLFTNALGANLAVAGIANDSTAALTAGDFKLGTITFETATAQRADLHLLSGDVGSASATAYGLSVARTSTSATGTYSISTLEPGTYDITASRAVTDIGNAITSADALAALKMAVGLNPNPDPDGTGPLSAPVVSPYQFMAADVTGTEGRVNSADALAILKMVVKLPTAPAKEWMFVEESRDFWNETTGQFTLSRNSAGWDHAISTNLQANGAVNLVGVLKGDVNGSWAAPAGSIDLDVIDPTHFSTLSSIFGMPVAQFGVV